MHFAYMPHYLNAFSNHFMPFFNTDFTILSTLNGIYN